MRHRRRYGNAETKADAHTERRCAERVGLRRLLADPEAEVVLPPEKRHAGDPWRWD